MPLKAKTACDSKEFFDDLNNTSDRDLEEYVWRMDPQIVRLFEDGMIRKQTEVNPQQRTRLGKFLYALALAGLLEGKKISEDRQRAKELLEGLIEEDPKNLSPILYRALIAHQEQRQEDQECWLKRADQGTHYNSYIRDMTKALRLADEPKFYFVLYGIWATSPVPNLEPLMKFLRQLGPRALAFGRAMMHEGLTAKGRISDVDWQVVEYEIGLLIVRDFDPEGMKLPRAKELYRRQKGSDLDLIELLERQDCDTEKVRGLLRKI
jgi:hypothetical protein